MTPFFQMPTLICRHCGLTPIEIFKRPDARQKALTSEKPYVDVKCSDMDCVKGTWRVYLSVPETVCIA